MAAKPMTDLPESVGLYYAKTHLPELLHRVEHGECINITQNGETVVTLEAFHEEEIDVEDIKKAIAEMESFQREHTLDGLSIRTLIETGRRF